MSKRIKSLLMVLILVVSSLALISCGVTESGDKGPIGDKGEIGDKGPIGDNGLDGNKGPNGEKGPTGDKGPTGNKGEQGDKGPNGASDITVLNYRVVVFTGDIRVRANGTEPERKIHSNGTRRVQELYKLYFYEFERTIEEMMQYKIDIIMHFRFIDVTDLYDTDFNIDNQIDPYYSIEETFN